MWLHTQVQTSPTDTHAWICAVIIAIENTAMFDSKGIGPVFRKMGAIVSASKQRALKYDILVIRSDCHKASCLGLSS